MKEQVHNEWHDVPQAYKVACCKTIYTHRKLRGLGGNRDFNLQIYNAVTKQLESEFKYTIDDKTIAEI